MPDPSTTRLGLYKSKSDGSELVNYPQDIGANLDKIDLAVGFQSCTSSTRPSTPYSGKPIYETDTTRTYFSNGSSPASASWVELPNANNNVLLAAGKQVNIGGSGSTATFAAVNPLITTDVLSSRVTGDTQSRFLVDADGTINWGPGGSTVPDVNLYRSGVNTLKTDDALVVVGNLSTNGTLSATGALTAGNYSVIMDWTALSSLGSYSGTFSAGSRTPRMRKISQQGTEIWELEGLIATSAWTANSAQTAFTFSAGHRTVSERGFATYSVSGAFYPIRVGILSTGVLSVGAPTAAGTGVVGIMLDGLRITNPAA